MLFINGGNKDAFHGVPLSKPGQGEIRDAVESFLTGTLVDVAEALPGLGQDNLFLASGGTSTFVEPTSLISTVVVRSLSNSLRLKLTVPLTLISYLLSTASLSQNITAPLALLTVGPSPCRGLKVSSSLAHASVKSPVKVSPFFLRSLAPEAISAACS